MKYFIFESMIQLIVFFITFAFDYGIDSIVFEPIKGIRSNSGTVPAAVSSI